MKKLAFFFLKLGLIGFGGPAAHIAMMRNELVDRYKWMTDEEFLTMTGLTNLIPGPNSTEMAILIGKNREGWKGLLISGFLFIVPAVLLSFVLALLYVKYNDLPAVQPFIYGIKPAIIAIIISAVLPLAKSAYRNLTLLYIGIASFILSISGLNELIIMIAAGLLYLFLRSVRIKPGSSMRNKTYKGDKRSFPFIASIGGFLSVSGTSLSLLKIFLVFFKVGAILYGSGYVLFAFLETDLVNTGLITKLQLTDAIAVGQMTPGPVFSSVTFIGYLLKGWQGALVATVGVFMPSFIFIALLSNYFDKLKTNPAFMIFLSGVIASSVALIAAVALSLGLSSISDWKSGLIAITACFISLMFRKINSAFVVIGGTMAGYLLSMV